MLKFSPVMALVLAGCATAPAQPPLVRATASGFAEGTFHKTTIAEVQQKFAAECVARGRMVEDINPIQISCGKDDWGLRAEIWHYTTTWTLIQAGADVRATAQGFMGYPGGPKSPILGNNSATNKMQATLLQLGAE